MFGERKRERENNKYLITGTSGTEVIPWQWFNTWQDKTAKINEKHL